MNDYSFVVLFAALSALARPQERGPRRRELPTPLAAYNERVFVHVEEVTWYAETPSGASGSLAGSVQGLRPVVASAIEGRRCPASDRFALGQRSNEDGARDYAQSSCGGLARSRRMADRGAQRPPFRPRMALG